MIDADGFLVLPCIPTVTKVYDKNDKFLGFWDENEEEGTITWTPSGEGLPALELVLPNE